MSEIHLSEHEIQNFVQSNMWNVMCFEMNAWLTDIREQLEVTQELDTLRRLQGNAEAVRRFLELPNQLKETIEAGLSL